MSISATVVEITNDKTLSRNEKVAKLKELYEVTNNEDLQKMIMANVLDVREGLYDQK